MESAAARPPRTTITVTSGGASSLTRLKADRRLRPGRGWRRWPAPSGLAEHAPPGAPDLQKPAQTYSSRIPEMARAITSRWISEVPSKMVKILELRAVSEVIGLRDPLVSAAIQHAPSEMNSGFGPTPNATDVRARIRPSPLEEGGQEVGGHPASQCSQVRTECRRRHRNSAQSDQSRRPIAAFTLSG